MDDESHIDPRMSLEYTAIGTYEALFYDINDPATRLWLAVVEKMVLDYAYLVRANQKKTICGLQRYNLELLTRSIFNSDGSMADILGFISHEPDIVADRIRATITPEIIESEIVLGRKMREVEY